MFSAGKSHPEAKCFSQVEEVYPRTLYYTVSTHIIIVMFNNLSKSKRETEVSELFRIQVFSFHNSDYIIARHQNVK